MKLLTVNNQRLRGLPTKAKRLGSMAGLLALAALGGCAVYPANTASSSYYESTYVTGDGYITHAPPAPIYETVTVSPGVGFVWTPGNWIWRDNRYVWNTGRWQRPPHGYTHWQPGRWTNNGRSYRYVDGQWARGRQQRPFQARPLSRPSRPEQLPRTRQPGWQGQRIRQADWQQGTQRRSPQRELMRQQRMQGQYLRDRTSR